MAKQTSNLEKYYNKFNEENRLHTRHGLVEFETSLKYIHDFLPKDKNPSEVKILDLGAGTGRYSVALNAEGYDVTAVELVKRNLEVLRGKHTSVKTWGGDARNISFLDDDTFDLTIMFGPCYHLHGDEEKLKALKEASRVTKKNGIILVAYVMNDYSVLSYCFGEDHIPEILEKGAFAPDFHILTTEDDLYDYVRLEDMTRLNEKAGLERIKTFSPDGPSDYMRPKLNAMDEETFSVFKKYVLAVAERPEMLGSGSHTVDVLRNTKL